jgi:hypothetical protein
MAFLKTIGGLPSFSFDPANVVWESGTVTYVAIQLAYYMGFSKIILIGVDHSFNTKGAANMTVISKGKDLNHFTPDYFKEGCRWQLPDLQTSELGYGLAKKVFEEDDRKIVDATLGGKLEVFPKLHFENIFESE